MELKGLEAAGTESVVSLPSMLERPEELTMRGVRSDDTSGVSGLHMITLRISCLSSSGAKLNVG